MEKNTTCDRKDRSRQSNWGEGGKSWEEKPGNIRFDWGKKTVDFWEVVIVAVRGFFDMDSIRGGGLGYINMILAVT